jgi:tyrosine-specific transport protein
MLNKKFFYALSTLIGMIIGVGIFGIPYSFAQAGFLIGFFYLIILAGVVLLVHLLYGEIILRTEKESRMVGYGEKYLGTKGKTLTTAVGIFQFYGALLAYIIAGGHFLNIILNRFLGGSDFSWSLIFFVFGALVIFFGLRTVALSEFLMTILLLAIAIFFIFKGAPLINFGNLNSLNPMKFFLPYGIVLFSLTGGAAVPELRQILKGQERKIKKVIILGTLIPAFIYFLFALVVVGVTGPNTTEDAISGLVSHLGQGIIILGAVFGFLAVITSFLMLGLNLRKMFQLDYKLNKFLAWVLACFVPLAAFLLGFKDFILLIGLIGAVAGGLEGITIIWIYVRAKKMGDRRPEYSLRLNKIFVFGLIFLFAIGIIYHFVYLAK